MLASRCHIQRDSYVHFSFPSLSAFLLAAVLLLDNRRFLCSLKKLVHGFMCFRSRSRSPAQRYARSPERYRNEDRNFRDRRQLEKAQDPVGQKQDFNAKSKLATNEPETGKTGSEQKSPPEDPLPSQCPVKKAPETNIIESPASPEPE